MKTTRRRLFAALTGLIAIPVLPRAASHSASSTCPPTARSLRDCLATQSYPNPGECTRDPWFETWDATARQPLTLADIQARQEFIQCELHAHRLTQSESYLISQLESSLDHCRLARRILELQPTGRPLTFHYAGGSTPHRPRTILPTLLFQPADITEQSGAPFAWHQLAPLYLQAYCIDRLAPRTFRLDRMKNATPLT